MPDWRVAVIALDPELTEDELTRRLDEGSRILVGSLLEGERHEIATSEVPHRP